MKLNQSQLRSFFYGTLLGDSYIYKGSFNCKQISEDLIIFKKEIIESFIPNIRVSITSYEGYTDKNGVNHQKYFQLYASPNEYVKKLDSLFYPDGKKICPPGVIEKLDPLGLAMWYADDGTTILVQKNSTTQSSKSRRIQLCTDSFTKEEHLNIILPELKQIQIPARMIQRTSLLQRTQLQPIIKIQPLFVEMGEYFYNFFPSLLYKMDLGYRNESLLNRTYVIENYYNFYLKMSTHALFKDRLLERV